MSLRSLFLLATYRLPASQKLNPSAATLELYECLSKVSLTKDRQLFENNEMFASALFEIQFLIQVIQPHRAYN